MFNRSRRPVGMIPQSRRPSFLSVLILFVLPYDFEHGVTYIAVVV